MSDANPYRAPSAEIADIPQNGELELAGIGHRFGALVLDAAIALVVLLVLAYTVYGTVDPVWNSEDSYRSAAIMAGVSFVLFIVLHAYFLKKRGQTIGKKIVGIRIVDRDGNVPGLGRLLFRRYLPIHLYSALPIVGTVLAVIDVLLVFRHDRRCLHDLLAGTRVVIYNTKHSSVTWFMAPLFLLFAMSIAIPSLAPMLDSPPPKKPKHTAHTAPKNPPAAQKPATQTTAHANPAPAAHPAAPGPTAPTQPALAQAAAAPAPAAARSEAAVPQPSEARLRKCATLGDAAAIIRCSQAEP